MSRLTPPAPPAAQLQDVVALDGPAGTGKSTVARAVAAHLGWRYVDTGATYRAATLAVLRAGIALTDTDAVTRCVAAARVELVTDPAAPTVLLDGEDVSAAVRGAEVTAAVSAVSAVPAVRAHLLELQRAALGTDGAVGEGRDVGTTVAPQARVKVFLDASPEVRAARRAGDTSAGVAATGTALLEAVQADLARRDALDSGRATSPTAAATDAARVDTSELDVAGVVAEVLRIAADAGIGR